MSRGKVRLQKVIRNFLQASCKSESIIFNTTFRLRENRNFKIWLYVIKEHVQLTLSLKCMRVKFHNRFSRERRASISIIIIHPFFELYFSETKIYQVSKIIYKSSMKKINNFNTNKFEYHFKFPAQLSLYIPLLLSPWTSMFLRALHFHFPRKSRD